MDKAGKIKFTMEIAGDTGFEFLDLKLKINESIKELMSMVNPPIVLAIQLLTPAIQKTTYATYIEV